jgi:hypothetical protein
MPASVQGHVALCCIEKAVHDALTGHASSDVGDQYGLGYPLETLAAAIKKLPVPKAGSAAEERTA